MSEGSQGAVSPQAPAPAPPRRRRLVGFVVIGALIVAAIVARDRYQKYNNTHIRTDDAYVEGTIHTVARERLAEAESALRAETLRAGELAAARAGAGTRIAAAEANLARVVASREELAAAVAVREAEVRSRTVALGQAQSDLARAESLFAKKVLPRDRLEQAQTAAASAREALAAAQQLQRQAEIALANHASSAAQARAAVAVEKAALDQTAAALRTHGEQVKGREAQTAIARLALGYARVLSPAEGYVTKKAVEVGNQVQAGQPLLAVVSLADLSIVANYKETQLHAIQPGLPVRIRVDAVPDREFTGRVHSVMAGTGAAFSLFPPENASGNYIKVVQRIPVKIVLDPGQGAEEVLRVGMSANPTILAEP